MRTLPRSRGNINCKLSSVDVRIDSTCAETGSHVAFERIREKMIDLQSRYNQGVVPFLAKPWRLLVLALAGSGLNLVAAPAVHDLPSVLDFPAVSGWVLADLNGDNNVDLATARSGRHDARGYTQEVRITLGAFQQTTFHFLSPGAKVELSSRDVDGDQDSDLVILEPVSREPIGVWINDGTGLFHEGNLADFEALLGHGRSSSSLLPPHQCLPLLAISEERVQLAVPQISISAADGILELLAPRSELPRQELFQSDFRPRAPPARS
jgi:hypothetical protein